MFAKFFRAPKRSFNSLSEREILALAISSEEDDGRVYLAYADALRQDYPASAKVFEEMAAEEDHHRGMLIDMYRQRFGERIPLIRREHVEGFYARKPVWLAQKLPLEDIRRQAASMEDEAYNFLYGGSGPRPRRRDAQAAG